MTDRASVPAPDSRAGHAITPRAQLLALAAIVSVPLVFTIATHGNWLLDFGGEDNWIYIKLFSVWGHAHPELREILDQNYKASRIPWVLPGYLLYQLLGPLPATYVLHLTVLLAGAILFWAGARRLFGDGVALVVTLLLLAYPGFHGSGITLFWNYHGQAALTYYFLAGLGVILGATTRRAVLGYALAGAGLALCLSTSLTYVVMLPAFAVFALAVHEQIDIRRLATMLAAGLVGAVSAAVLLGGINLLIGGPFLYFMPQIAFTIDTAIKDEWRPSFQEWFLGVRWLGLPPLVAAVSLIAAVPLARSTTAGAGRQRILGYWLQLLVAWATLIVLEVRGQPLVEVAYLYHMILGPTAYSLAALIWAGIELDRRPIHGLAVLGFAYGLVLPQVGLSPETRGTLRQILDLSNIAPVPPSEFWGTAALMLAGLLLLVIALRERPAWTVAAGGVIGVAFATTAILPEAYLPPTPCSYYASQFRVAQRIIVWSAAEQIDTDAILWYDRSEALSRGDDCAPIPMFPIYNAIQHGTMIRPSEVPLPTSLTDVKAGVRAAAARNRSTMVLLSTPETATRAAEMLTTWSAQRPNPAQVRAVARHDASDGAVTVVVQVFELRRP